MLSRIYIQCFENNRGAEKVEANYERLKNPKKMFWPQESNWPHQSEIRTPYSLTHMIS
jgi:hypothetical protein